MQELSFEFKNPMFSFADSKFSVMIYTFVNAYALDESKTVTEEKSDALTVTCKGLTWAGGQEKTAGRVKIIATKTKTGLRFSISASIDNDENIRCVKLTLHEIEDGEIINLINASPRPIPAEGLNLKYPEGWRDVGTPLLILKALSGKLCYYKSLDNRVRDKRFVFTRVHGGLAAELIFEETAVEMKNSVTVPDWKIGFGSSIAEIYTSHKEHIQQSYGLKTWETRNDVPGWARKISLVASIHCQHWTGYVFNDYKDVLLILEKICKQLNGENVLAYLPGWEGRYYWQYGDYRPDERMGGEDGFRMLCDGAKKLGVHIMPMFGINIVGSHFAGYEEWGHPSEFCSPSGNIYCGSVDWDASRHFDHGSNRNLNPAAPKWQNRLFSQVTTLMNKYGFDAAFFDIAAVWMNDPNHYLYDGVKKLMDRFKAYNPDMLLAGEAWYDGLAARIPLVQCGHTDGVLHWHDEAYAPFFDEYARGFGHLCLGDPSRGSTGVHELGFNPIRRCPVRKGIIPTITIVNDSLEKAPEKCSQIFEDAKEYARRYIQ